MIQYIDKSELLTEIERYKHKADERLKIKGRTLAEDLKDSALQNLCGNLLHFLNNLEVKEVDLEKEYDNEFFKDPVFGKLVNRNAGISIAKHFFELGLKTQK